MSLLFAGLNDIAFKKFSVKTNSRGMYIFGIGVIWSVIQALVVILNKESVAHTPATYIFGISAGFVLCLSNILLLESLKYLDLSVGSTIYRLNTIGVVFLSVLVLYESIDWIKGIGIFLGILAVFLLYEPASIEQTEKKRFLIFFVVAIVASFLRATYGVITKAGISNQADLPTMVLLASSCWIVGGLFYAVVKEKIQHFDLRTSIYSSISGIMVFLIVFFLTRGLQNGAATLVIPIANMSFLVAILLAALMRMENFTWKKGAAVFMASSAIVCLSITSSH